MLPVTSTLTRKTLVSVLAAALAIALGATTARAGDNIACFYANGSCDTGALAPSQSSPWTGSYVSYGLDMRTVAPYVEKALFVDRGAGVIGPWTGGANQAMFAVTFSSYWTQKHRCKNNGAFTTTARCRLYGAP